MFIGAFEEYKGTEKYPISPDTIKKIRRINIHHIYLDKELKYVVDIIEIGGEECSEWYYGGKWIDACLPYRYGFKAKYWKLSEAPTMILMFILSQLAPELYEKLTKILPEEPALFDR